MTPDIDCIARQKEAIKKYIEGEQIHLKKMYSSVKNATKNKENHEFDNFLDEIFYGDMLIVYDLSVFGETLPGILKKIGLIRQKGIELYCVFENLLIGTQNQILHSFVDALIQLDVTKQSKKSAAAASTRKNNGTKIGRKAGKKTKSMFDKYRKKILKMDNQGIPKTKILAMIKENDEEFANISVQALGQYIKKLERLRKERAQKSNPYDLGMNLMKLDGSLRKVKKRSD